MNINEALNFAAKELKNAGINLAKLEAEILLGHTLNIDRKEFILQKSSSKLDNAKKELFLEFIKRRKKNEPIAYIVESKEFYGFEFKVNKNTLIPRPETELLIDEICKEFDENEKFNVLDLGCGSGCIGITIAKLFPNSYVDLCDISDEALSMAEENSRLLKVDSRTRLLKSDWFKDINANYNLIVSNPPYIAQDDIRVCNETKSFEPKGALYSGADGLDSYRLIAKNAHNFMENNALLMLEHGEGQKNNIIEIFNDNILKFHRKITDLSGSYRHLVFKKH